MSLFLATENVMEDVEAYSLLFLFGGIDCSLYSGPVVPAGAHPVSLDLGSLVYSAQDYPPALALTRKRLRDTPVAHKQAALQLLGDQLNYYLARQPSDPFILAKAAVPRGVDFVSGAFYWVVDVADEVVSWISRDYWIYSGVVQDFDEPQKIIEAFAKPFPRDRH